AGIGPLRERQLWFSGVRSWAELGGAAPGWRRTLAAPRRQAARRSRGLPAQAGGGRSGLLRPRPPADRALASSAAGDRRCRLPRPRPRVSAARPEGRLEAARGERRILPATAPCKAFGRGRGCALARAGPGRPSRAAAARRVQPLRRLPSAAAGGARLQPAAPA